MVTKLKDNLSYIKYIRKKMKENFPEWNEIGVVYERQPNNNFGISFKHEDYKISFMKDRGQLELDIYNSEELMYKGEDFYNSILEKVPEQNPNWLTSLCTEIIDYCIAFLKNFPL